MALETLPPIPAEQGLGGAPSMATQAQQPEETAPPTVEGPATSGPANPGMSVARHIMAALGGSSGQPMDWAKGIISGGLAAAANVGKAPEGAGGLYGAAKGAQGVVELNREKALDARAAQKQQFEQQMKTREDARAEKELQIHLEDTKVQRAMWNADTLAKIHADQRAEALRPYMEAEEKAKLDKVRTEQAEVQTQIKATLLHAGMTPEQVDKVYTNSADAPSDAAKNIGSGQGIVVHSGEKPSADEDKVGVHHIQDAGNIWEKPLEKDTQVIGGYDYDGKTGKFTPRMVTAVAGTPTSTILALSAKADRDLQQQQKQLTDAAELKQKSAQTQAELASAGHARAETAKTLEETKQLKEWDIGGKKEDAFGNTVGAPGMDKKEFVKRVDTYNKDYSKDLNQLDAARSQLTDIIKNAEETGKLPGADAVVGIFDAIGLSSAPLKGRGFRINNQVVGEHVEGTRNAWQGAALKLSRLTPEGTGQIVSLQQLKDYQRIMDQARHDAYVGAGNDAVNRGIGIQNAPRGNGTPVDPNTMDIFLTLAHGDPKIASSIAKQYGWTPPR